jgi:hypothetical protein
VASRSLRGVEMAARCAWCGRYRVGEEWVPVGPVPAFSEAAHVTHGICDECIAALRDSGMSL